MYSPVSTTLGAKRATPEAADTLGLAEQGDELAGCSAGEPRRHRTPHDVTDEPDRLLDIGEQQRLARRRRFGWECR